MLLFGILGVFPLNGMASSVRTLDKGEIEYIKVNADIMEINLEKSYVVIAEKWFEIGEFKVRDKVYQTILLGPDGGRIPLNRLKKGQRVVVIGIKLPDDQYMADSVQIKATGKEGLKKYRLIPQVPSVKPLP